MNQVYELPLSRKPDRTEVPIELVRRQPTAAAAFSLACQASGLEDKEISLPLGIDAGTFSRIKTGLANLPADKEYEFCKLVGNRIYPEWRAYQLGCTLVLIKSELERRADELQEMLVQSQAREKMLTDILAGRGKS